jgi:hypothetical protein
MTVEEQRGECKGRDWGCAAPASVDTVQQLACLLHLSDVTLLALPHILSGVTSHQPRVAD